MGKVIFVLLDACRFDAATEYAGYLEHLIDTGMGAKYKVWGELPSLSRPMYETLMTGLPSSVHGIATNKTVRRSRCPNLFSLCRQAGLTTAAAVYGWYSDLYAKSPFTPADRYQLDGKEDIQYGIYYFEDQYPDSHLFLDGEFLRKTYHPDFLMMHSMNIDYWGHLQTSDSQAYANAVQTTTEFLGGLLPGWLEDGYQVVITADHGMNHLGIHGGTAPGQRTTPLYIFSPLCQPGRFTDEAISQLHITPLLCRLLGLSPAPGMLSPSAVLPSSQG